MGAMRLLTEWDRGTDLGEVRRKHAPPQSSFQGAPTDPRKARPDDRLRASPESITPAGSMDSGPAPKGASRNDRSSSIAHHAKRILDEACGVERAGVVAKSGDDLQ